MQIFRHLLLISLFWCGANSSSAQTWTQTDASTNLSWGTIACSADGTKLVAAGSGIGIWVSTNSGATWAVTSPPNTNTNISFGATLSADGTKLVASDGAGLIYTSSDLGTTWTSNSAPVGLGSIALSADGTKLVASAAGGFIYTSVDSGTTWISNSVPGSSAVHLAISPDGNRLLAATGADILVSTNSGATWQSVASGIFYMQSFASSASGSTLVVGCEGYILVSTNAGMTWNSNGISVFGSLSILSPCVSSADGTTLAAVAGSAIVGYRGAAVIFVSTNSGTTWIQADAPIKIWTGIACSADGGKLVGSASYSPFTPFPSAQIGGIYTLQTIPAPQLSITPTNDNLTVSWVVPSTNFVMQQSSDLHNWADMTNQAVLNLANLQDEVVLPPPGSNVFYRLKTP